MPLKGKFDLAEFKRKCEDCTRKNKISMPPIYYTAGQGETLESLFKELIVWPALRNNRRIQDIYYNIDNKSLKGKPDLEGERIKIYSAKWLETNRSVPADVMNAIRDFEEWARNVDKPARLTGEEAKIDELNDQLLK